MARHTPDGSEDFSWLPPTCTAGHPLVPGSFTLSWQQCRCPWADGTGHHYALCKRGCRPASYPPGCGPDQAQPHTRITL